MAIIPPDEETGEQGGGSGLPTNARIFYVDLFGPSAIDEVNGMNYSVTPFDPDNPGTGKSIDGVTLLPGMIVLLQGDSLKWGIFEYVADETPMVRHADFTTVGDFSTPLAVFTYYYGQKNGSQWFISEHDYFVPEPQETLLDPDYSDWTWFDTPLVPRLGNVDPTVPSQGDVLTYDSGQWKPVSSGGAGLEVSFTTNFLTGTTVDWTVHLAFNGAPLPSGEYCLVRVWFTEEAGTGFPFRSSDYDAASLVNGLVVDLNSTGNLTVGEPEECILGTAGLFGFDKGGSGSMRMCVELAGKIYISDAVTFTG